MINLLLIILLTCLLTASPDLSATEKPSPIKLGGTIGALNDRSITDAEIAFQVIFNELLAEANESFSLKIYKDQNLLFDRFRRGELQGILTGSLHFIELDSLIHNSARYSVQYGDKLKQNYLLLVRHDDNLTSLRQLKEKTLSMGASHQVGKLFLDVELLQQQLPLSDQFFKEIHIVKGDNTSIIDLYFGKVDAAVVPKFTFETSQTLNPQIKNKIEVLASSEPMIHQVVGLRHDFPQHRIDNFEPHILTDQPSKRLINVFETFGIERIHRVTEESFKEVKSLQNRYNKLNGLSQ
ncbi:MAG: phosphate/phosphite/phosphonate ABC transporter substrate-binding protein [Candidatus Thiodiazotropha weberae]|uniref:Solute-binding protein family 3/N-terminal domain-containing protein n=1 Tax=Candidatus Thiodiazotropha endoloripes TaxID=1818881 RepID=A0A1E2UMZ3_9GAMM|nr:PhnD/SsuA/transferrin family substrate-binding protein [Candidatus Thiodiazotropha endoloripes]MCG7900247.1 phosphate/phosphite/phosphonate ABC transporter substrate-binding protein [Candidatus Thiodiazotropha weberae]ODB95905.1 hypothetical protein A3196_03505 [Candidatus Thiodiazotropha endoloripes]